MRTSLTWPGESWLDIKLGLRLLRKYPGLTVIGGIAMAVAIAFGTASFAFFHSYLDPMLPLPEGDRIVALENWNVSVNNEERRAGYDLGVWRREMRTVQDIGAFRNVGRNLLIPGRSVEPILAAEITAAGFGVPRIGPLLGRSIAAADEEPAADAVLVIGHDVWQTRFGGDPSVIGREVRVGSTVHVVVGVMPEGFAFPMHHSYWIPMKLRSAPQPGTGPSLHIFGRLAPNETIESAQAELAIIGERHAAAYPDTHAHLRPQVLPYSYPLLDIQDVSLWQVGVMQSTVSMLLVIVALNVAILVYARTATRQGEIAVRTALGASRRRIVTQLFIEALVLSACSGIAGLLLAGFAMKQGHALMQTELGRMPFWITGGVPPMALLYVGGVVVLAAMLAGIIPALQATRRKAHTSLRQLGGGTGLQLGTTWTLLIVAQVGIAVAGLPVVVATGWREVRQATAAPVFAAEEYMGVRLSFDTADVPPGPAGEGERERLRTRLARLHDEMVGRIEADPSVVDVSRATSLPGTEPSVRIETEGASGAAVASGHDVRINQVDTDFFDAFEVAVLAGRLFSPAEADVAVVNRTFAERIFGDRAAGLGQASSVLGRRVRHVDPDRPERERWVEIVGIVGDLYTNRLSPEMTSAELYRPLDEDTTPSLVVRMRGGDPASLSNRFREVATGLEPDVRVGAISLAQVYRQDKLALRLVTMVLGAIVVSVLLLSAAGIYALVSFTVSRRRREIGIRAALGAEPAGLLRSVFTRAAVQIGLGVIVGLVTIAVLDVMSEGGLLGGRHGVLLPAIAVLMLSAGFLATVGPARRALRIQPIDALRED